MISKIGVAHARDKPFKPSTIKIKVIIVICADVFSLATIEVTIDIPLCSIAILNPVTKKSLKIITPTIQNSIMSNNANEINADETRILSASGSKNLPSLVISLYFRA